MVFTSFLLFMYHKGTTLIKGTSSVFDTAPWINNVPTSKKTASRACMFLNSVQHCVMQVVWGRNEETVSSLTCSGTLIPVYDRPASVVTWIPPIGSSRYWRNDRVVVSAVACDYSNKPSGSTESDSFLTYVSSASEGLCFVQMVVGAGSAFEIHFGSCVISPLEHSGHRSALKHTELCAQNVYVWSMWLSK